MTGRFFAAAACVAAALGGTVAAQTASSAASRSGSELFAENCVACHGEGGWGTRSLQRRTPPGEALLTSRRVLPPALVRFAVRRGVGSMPQFSRTDLSDEELEILARWLDEANPDE